MRLVFNGFDIFRRKCTFSHRDSTRDSQWIRGYLELLVSGYSASSFVYGCRLSRTWQKQWVHPCASPLPPIQEAFNSVSFGKNSRMEETLLPRLVKEKPYLKILIGLRVRIFHRLPSLCFMDCQPKTHSSSDSSCRS